MGGAKFNPVTNILKQVTRVLKRKELKHFEKEMVMTLGLLKITIILY
jgi:hypothetical protein